jgi:hypothetical protein
MRRPGTTGLSPSRLVRSRGIRLPTLRANGTGIQKDKVPLWSVRIAPSEYTLLHEISALRRRKFMRWPGYHLQLPQPSGQPYRRSRVRLTPTICGSQRSGVGSASSTDHRDVCAVGGMGQLRASGSGDGLVGGLHGWGFRGVPQPCLWGAAVSVPEVGRGPGSASCRGVSRPGRLRWPWRGSGGSAAASAVRVRILASRSSR